MKSLKDSIYLYEFKPEINQGLKVTKDKLLTSKTISMFQALYGTEDKNIYESIKTPLHKIRKQEKVLHFNKEKIYFHTYNLLFIIHRYLLAINFYNSNEYKNTFAALRGSEDEMQDKYHQHRANIFDSSNAFTGDDKVKALIFRNFYSNRETMDLYANFYTLFPKHMVKVDSEDEFFKKILDKIVEHFASTYIASEDVIYKSLAISLNSYFRLKMKMQAKHSKQISEEILYTLFEYKFSASSADMLRNIYISGRLNELPIFKHAKKSRVLEDNTIENFNKLFNELKREFADLENISIDAKSYFQENPIKQFLLLSPMEFLQEIK